MCHDIFFVSLMSIIQSPLRATISAFSLLFVFFKLFLNVDVGYSIMFCLLTNL